MGSGASICTQQCNYFWILKADVNYADDKGMSALSWVDRSSAIGRLNKARICGGRAIVAQLLIDSGANVDAADHNGDPLLVWPAFLGDSETVKGAP